MTLKDPELQPLLPLSRLYLPFPAHSITGQTEVRVVDGLGFGVRWWLLSERHQELAKLIIPAFHPSKCHISNGRAGGGVGDDEDW